MTVRPSFPIGLAALVLCFSMQTVRAATPTPEFHVTDYVETGRVGGAPPASSPGAGDAEHPERLPEVTAVGERTDENRPVGIYDQPDWTTARRFATSRVYVLPEGQIEAETWFKGKFLGEGKYDHLYQQELAVGLPHRVQLDLYTNFTSSSEEDLEVQGVQAEARWALADWDDIPLNPTVYFEWKFPFDEPDAAEVKLLLGDDIGEDWHWGTNFFFEQEVSGEEATEMGFSQALGRSLIDSTLGLGAELQFEMSTVKGSRDDPAYELLIGPSVQWRPTEGIHLDFVPLFGVTDDSPDVEMFGIFGIELGRPKQPLHRVPMDPASSRSR